MKLFHIQFDGQSYWVEAPSYSTAIEAWKRHVAVAWEADYNGDEEPESCALVHDEPVIRT